MSINEEEEDEPKSGWVAMWHALVSIVFVLACMTYCMRAEIVEILK